MYNECSGITVHGEDGLGGARPPLEESDTQFGAEAASEFIYKTCKKASGEITLVTLGPLTNIALSLRENLPQRCPCVSVSLYSSNFCELRVSFTFQNRKKKNL